jgi:hypothetical protein
MKRTAKIDRRTVKWSGKYSEEFYTTYLNNYRSNSAASNLVPKILSIIGKHEGTGITWSDLKKKINGAILMGAPNRYNNPLNIVLSSSLNIIRDVLYDTDLEDVPVLLSSSKSIVKDLANYRLVVGE